MEEQIVQEVEQTTEPMVETNEESVKTFTQEEVNEIVAKEKARVKKNIPSKEELDAYKEWKESQKTDEEKQKETYDKLASLESNNNTLKQEILLLRKGISVEDIDYVQFKVSKMGGNFEEDLESYLNDNPKFIAKETKATGVQIKGTPIEQEDGVMAILKSKYPELN